MAPNLFYLKSSVLKNEGAGDSLSLYPYGCGDEASTHTAYIARGNAGNAVIDVEIKDDDGQQFDKVVMKV